MAERSKYVADNFSNSFTYTLCIWKWRFRAYTAERASLNNQRMNHILMMCRSLFPLSTHITKLLADTWRDLTNNRWDTYSYNGGSRLWGTYSASAPWGSPCPPPPFYGEVKTGCHTTSSWDSRGAPRGCRSHKSSLMLTLRSLFNTLLLMR